MPEREAETVRAGPSLRVGDLTLLPIVGVVVRSGRSGRALWVTAAVEPRALVVRDAGGVRVLEAGGAAGSIEQLRASVPGLGALLEALEPAT